MALGCPQLLLYLLDASVKIVHQVLLLGVGSLSLRLLLELMVCIFNFFLQVGYLLFVLLNNFLAEMRSLGQFFFDFLMILEVFSQVGDHTFHLMVLEHEILRPL